MSLSICPAANVAAPIEVVWDLLNTPAKYGEWADAKVEFVVPPGRLAPGQIILLAAPALGRNWQVRFDVETVDPERHEIQLHVHLPLGMRLEEHLSTTSIGARSCLVQYG
jgi:hypothetical protein